MTMLIVLDKILDKAFEENKLFYCIEYDLCIELFQIFEEC
jgi:hypothetical protein